MTNKKLYRDTSHKMITGVCAGIANRIGIPPLIIRIAWIALTACTYGIGGLAAYLVCTLLIPADPGYIDV